TYFIQMIPMSANTLYLGRNQAWLQKTWDQYLLDTGANQNPNGFQSQFETFIASWQARMPPHGSDINGTCLVPTLRRIENPHAFQFFGTNTMAKYWAYTNNRLGQVDTSYVADVPAYGVFKLPGGGYTFVAYNATGAAITAHFTQRKGANRVDLPVE